MPTTRVPDCWTATWDALHARIAPRFARAESRTRVRRYLDALLACWSARTTGNWPSTGRALYLPAACVSDPTERADYRVCGLAATTVETIVHVAGRRWCIETAFEEAKGLAIMAALPPVPPEGQLSL